MKILLDECVPQRLRNHLPGHECQSARYAGFGGLENGDLLTAAEAAKFDVLLTLDRGFEYEQNLAGRQIAVLMLSTKSIRLEDLLPHLRDALVALQSIQPGQIVRVGLQPEASIQRTRHQYRHITGPLPACVRHHARQPSHACTCGPMDRGRWAWPLARNQPRIVSGLAVAAASSRAIRPRR